MNNIKKIRKSQNMSVTELAKALNMSQSNLTKIENNQLILTLLPRESAFILFWLFNITSIKDNNELVVLDLSPLNSQ